MKLLTTTYSSPSSTTLSSDPTCCSSQSGAPGGCITTLLHRILCSGGLPTHPSEQIRELYSKSIEIDKFQKLKTNATNSPGIVARLMGLDSMAEIPSSLSRNRSLTSIEGPHRIVKSCSSFPDVPDFYLLENENFLEFSFENGGGGSTKLKSRGRRRRRRKEKGFQERNKREKVYDDEKGNDWKVQLGNSFCKDVSNCEKVKRRKKGETCCVESECSSEDSSPVSVFDFERKAPGTEVDLLGVGMSWRRKLSAELENKQLFNLHSNSNLMDEERNVEATEKNMHEGSKKKEKKRMKECVDIWGEICRLVEDELIGLNQEVKRKQSDFESISEDIESEIFDHLLDEVIDEFVGISLKALQI